MLLTQWHYHSSYCPQSSGKVKQTNGNLKLKLARLTESIGLPLPKILPSVLMAIGSTPMEKHKLTPYKIVTGRTMPLMIGPYVSPVFINSDDSVL